MISQAEGNRKRKGVTGMKWQALLLVALMAVVSLGVTECDQAGAVTGKEVRQMIEDLEVGEPVYYENLTVIPIYTVCIRDNCRYTTLDEALQKSWLEISEVEGGRVPQVRLTNHSGEHIYIMGGEILTGCRQDRIVGRDVLVRPRARNLIIPVYCVEQGRWSYESETFSSKKNLGTSRMRSVSQKAPEGAQTEIWSEVRGLCDRAGVSSGTSRYQMTYESDAARRRLADVKKRMGRLPDLYPDVVGVAIGVGEEITSVDIFANPHIFKQLWPKLLKSSSMAVVGSRGYGSLTQADVVRFLRMVHDKRFTRQAAIDLGFELSALDRDVNVSALVWRDAVTHLAAFPETGGWYGKSGDDERRIPVLRR